MALRFRIVPANSCAEICPPAENLPDNTRQKTKGVEMKGQDSDKVLRRIIQMLLALAVLAERAGGAPWPVRCLVLWILRRGEAAAGGFVREVAQTPLGIVDLSAFPHDNSPAGAVRLAMCFRALAAALRDLLHQPPRFMRKTGRSDGIGSPLVLRHLIEKALAGPPNSRAPPPPRLREGRQAQLRSRNGCLERFGASGDRVSARKKPNALSPEFVRRTIPLAISARCAHMGLGAWAASAAFP